jgi:hypothetical protein
MLRLILSFLLGFFAAWIYELTMIKLFSRNGLIIWNWKLHHSLYGLLFITLGFISKKTFLVGFGVGIIAQHALTDGFWFITKESLK